MTYKKTLISLPEAITKRLQKYADMANDGNKSRFIADAIMDKINLLEKRIHTARMSQAYQAAAKDSLRITKEWESLDNEAWRMLDENQGSN